MEPFTLKTFTLKDKSEVELRTAQEIKNHKDWMYDIGQQIQSLSQNMVDLSLNHEKVLAKSESDKKEILIAFENFQENVRNNLDNFCQRIGDLESRCIHLQIILGDKLNEMSNKFISKENHHEDLLKQINKLDVLLNILKENHDFINTEFSSVRSHIDNHIHNIRKEIPSIEEFKPLKKEIEEAIQVININFSGLVKEIALIKKDVAYDQKKFENVYTLIERLKEGIPCHKPVI